MTWQAQMRVAAVRLLMRRWAKAAKILPRTWLISAAVWKWPVRVEESS